MPESSLLGNDLVMNSFEALVNQSVLGNTRYLEENSETATLQLEYVTTVFFANALSRIGLALQMALPSDMTIKKELEAIKVLDDRLLDGKSIYNARDPSEPYVKARYQAYAYGTTWSLAQTGQYLGVAILCMHVFLALAHTIVLVVTKRSSAAWDSINELIVLAYNSSARPGAFENCNSGIELAKTLEKKVRIGTRQGDDGHVQVELVVCADDKGAGRVVVGEKYG
jgi:hypothetical protein